MLLTLMILFVTLFGYAQVPGAIADSTVVILPHFPKSVTVPVDVVVYTEDSLQHHTADYYRALAKVVQFEFGLDSTELPQPVRLVFVSKSLYRLIVTHNQDRFDTTENYLGTYVGPGLIFMWGKMEADDTFMHEYMHLLHGHGYLFNDVENEETVHEYVRMDEAMLLGTKTYLNFLRLKLK